MVPMIINLHVDVNTDLTISLLTVVLETACNFLEPCDFRSGIIFEGRAAPLCLIEGVFKEFDVTSDGPALSS